MAHHNIVFQQVLKYLPRYRFQKAVDRHDGDRGFRSLSCSDKLLSLLFGQLSGCQPLRDLVSNYNSKKSHHYHLGTQSIRRSSLADANSKRPVEIYQETLFYLLEKIGKKLPKKMPMKWFS